MAALPEANLYGSKREAQAQILATAQRVVEQMERHVVPYWDFFLIEWLDANELPEAQQALHDQARSHARDEPAAARAAL